MPSNPDTYMQQSRDSMGQGSKQKSVVGHRTRVRKEGITVQSAADFESDAVPWPSEEQKKHVASKAAVIPYGTTDRHLPRPSPLSVVA